MSVDGISPTPLAAAGSDRSSTPTDDETAQFQQALLAGLPSAAMSILMPIVSDTLSEINSMGDGTS